MQMTSDELAVLHQRIGNAVTAIISQYAATLDSRKVTSEASPGELEKVFDEPFPEKGIGFEEILDRYQREVIAHAMQVPSPRYFGQFNPTPLPIGVWADALSSVLNQNAGAWRNGPTSAMIEARVLRWLCELVGYPPQSFGVLASGGTEANLIALKCARDRTHQAGVKEGLRSAPGELTIYASAQCHFSIDRSVDVLGLGRASLRKIPADKTFHIIPDELRKQIEIDRQAGCIPCCVIGVAGTTS
ncbi:MAG TPA: pyridoxal-dependent decarboxylase, partial [Pyrinomonadaceae bacterium]|nr:pyridoxal-dependent decarboxylase [Pyrinomonadaceae bacterium]